MNEIASFVKEAIGTITNALGGFISIPLLLLAGLALLLGWLSKPGAGPKGFNQPIVTMVSWVVAFYLGLQSLTVLTSFGLKSTDVIIAAQIALIIGLFWLASFYGRLGTIICTVIAILVFVAIIATGNAGPSDSLLSNFVRTTESAVSTLFGSISHS